MIEKVVHIVMKLVACIDAKGSLQHTETGNLQHTEETNVTKEACNATHCDEQHASQQRHCIALRVGHPPQFHWGNFASPIPPEAGL